MILKMQGSSEIIQMLYHGNIHSILQLRVLLISFKRKWTMSKNCNIVDGQIEIVGDLVPHDGNLKSIKANDNEFLVTAPSFVLDSTYFDGPNTHHEMFSTLLPRRMPSRFLWSMRPSCSNV